jgi:hypothetical protein
MGVALDWVITDGLSEEVEFEEKPANEWFGEEKSLQSSTLAKSKPRIF